jgi:hypothetical protein
MPNTKNTEAKTKTFEAMLLGSDSQTEQDFLDRGDLRKPKRVRVRETGFAQRKRQQEELELQTPNQMQKVNASENHGFSGLSQLALQVNLVAPKLGNLASAPGCGKKKNKASSSNKAAQKKKEASKRSSASKNRRNRK